MSKHLSTDEHYKILIVDDDTAFSFLIAESLLKNGFDVVEIHNGRECLEKLDSIAPDLIILDVLMPAPDGFDTCHAIRKTPAFVDIPILMMTRLDDALATQSAFLAGATGYIGKPFDFDSLLLSVAKLLHNQQALLD